MRIKYKHNDLQIQETINKLMDEILLADHSAAIDYIIIWNRLQIFAGFQILDKNKLDVLLFNNPDNLDENLKNTWRDLIIYKTLNCY